MNGEQPETNIGFNVYFNTFTNQGHIQGGSRVAVITTDAITSSWKAEDWYVGQQLNLIDGGYFSVGSGGTVEFYGTVELTSISTSNPIPEPCTLLLFAFGGLMIRKKI